MVDFLCCETEAKVSMREGRNLGAWVRVEEKVRETRIFS